MNNAHRNEKSAIVNPKRAQARNMNKGSLNSSRLNSASSVDNRTTYDRSKFQKKFY